VHSTLTIEVRILLTSGFLNRKLYEKIKINYKEA